MNEKPKLSLKDVPKESYFDYITRENDALGHDLDSAKSIKDILRAQTEVLIKIHFEMMKIAKLNKKQIKEFNVKK